MTPIRAIRNYLIDLLATIGFTVFIYYQAIEIVTGTVEEYNSGKARLFNNIVELLGDKGVLAIGTLISSYLIYKFG